LPFQPSDKSMGYCRKPLRDKTRTFFRGGVAFVGADSVPVGCMNTQYKPAVGRPWRLWPTEWGRLESL